MTDTQPRDDLDGDSSNDDEPLSEMMKRKRAPERSQYLEEAPSTGHSSDGEPQRNLTKNKGSTATRSNKPQKTVTKKLSDSEDDEPLLTLMKKRKNKKKSDIKETADFAVEKELSDSNDDEPLSTQKRKNKKPDQEQKAVLGSKKSESQRKQKTEAKFFKHRPSSPSQEKTPQKRARKGKGETMKMASAHSTPGKTQYKKRGYAKKQHTERQAPSCDSSDTEPLVKLKNKKGQPEMKQVVVLLKRMSKRDIIDMIAQGHKCTQVQSSTTTTDKKSKAESSDEEPLSHKVKRLKQNSKSSRGRATAGLV